MSEQKEKNIEETLGEALALGADAPEKGDKEGKAAPKAPAPAARRVLPDLIETAIDKGIRVILTKTGYEIEGFYKGGPMRVEPEGASGAMAAIDRKDKRVIIKSFDDLARLNYDWWKKSRDKGAEFINPGREWIDEFVRLSLVKRQVIFIPGED